MRELPSSRLRVRSVTCAILAGLAAVHCDRSDMDADTGPAHGPESLTLSLQGTRAEEPRVGGALELALIHHTAWVRRDDGSREPGGVVSRTAGVEWTAAPADVARIDPSGRVTLLGEGHLRLVARCNGSFGQPLESNAVEVDVGPATAEPVVASWVRASTRPRSTPKRTRSANYALLDGLARLADSFTSA